MNTLRISHIVFTVFLLGHLSLFANVSTANDLPDTHGNRIAAAERYLQVYSIKDITRNMFLETAKNLPEDYRAPYIELMTKHTNVVALERACLASMVHHFTVSELNALANFYGSKEGKSVMGKFGAYMADIMPSIEQEVQKAQVVIKKELEEAKIKMAKNK